MTATAPPGEPSAAPPRVDRSSPSSLFDLVAALSAAMDMVSPRVVDHHQRTAWVAVGLAEELGLGADEVRRVLLASLLHDIGAFSLRERIDMLEFEVTDPDRHAALGWRLLEGFPPLAAEALMIRWHHRWWVDREGEGPRAEVPVGARLIHLADRTAVLLREGVVAEDLRREVLGRMETLSGTMFMPEAVGALGRLRPTAEAWQGAFRPDLRERLFERFLSSPLRLGTEEVEGLARVFSRIIDYRSHFTATHSAGVAAVAEALAGVLGFSAHNRRLIRVAGYLHDIGKLAVPVEILEKPGGLDALEHLRMQDHALQTRRLLERVPDLGYGVQWAAQHHERLDGSGYPDHSAGRAVAFGSRVVAVADILTAVTEDRPYRRGLERDQAMTVLHSLAGHGYLDREVVQAAEGHFEELDRARATAQAQALEDYGARISAASGPENG